MFDQITPSDTALAISSGITIYQIYQCLGYGGTELSFHISILIISFTVMLCGLKRNQEHCQEYNQEYYQKSISTSSKEYLTQRITS